MAAFDPKRTLELRAFVLDAEIRPIVGGRRWMRLVCAPVCDGDRPVRLHGLKFIV